MFDKIVTVVWKDSYTLYDRWTDFRDNFTAEENIIDSWGKVIFEDDKVIALAQNITWKAEFTNRQILGVMVIPKVSIIEITSF